MKRDPNIFWLPPHVDPRRVEHRTDAEWEMIFKKRVRENEQRRAGMVLYKPDDELPAFLKRQAGEH